MSEGGGHVPTPHEVMITRSFLRRLKLKGKNFPHVTINKKALIINIYGFDEASLRADTRSIKVKWSMQMAGSWLGRFEVIMWGGIPTTLEKGGVRWQEGWCYTKGVVRVLGDLSHKVGALNLFFDKPKCQVLDRWGCCFEHLLHIDTKLPGAGVTQNLQAMIWWADDRGVERIIAYCDNLKLNGQAVFWTTII